MMKTDSPNSYQRQAGEFFLHMLEIKDLGLIAYQQAYDIQQQCVDKVIADRDRSYVLLCEHPAVLTLGRLADEAHIIRSQEDLHRAGVSVFPVDRGGEVTLHAPGQLVVYPILNLDGHVKDLHRYLYKLEQVGIDFLRLFDIVGNRVSGKTGVWIETRKIMSIGIGVRKWVSYHGIGLNISTDLSLFDMIRPCGMDIEMTSLKKECAAGIDMVQAKEMFTDVFRTEFGV